MESESDIERTACTAAARAGWSVVKVGQHGWPDRLFFRHGVYVWVEFKRPGGRLSALQKRRIDRLRQSGERAIVVESADDFVPLLNRVAGEQP